LEKGLRKMTKPQSEYPAGFDIVTAVVMKRPVFWKIRLCIQLEASRCFEGTSVEFDGLHTIRFQKM
jgi:hypothetical protein